MTLSHGETIFFAVVLTISVFDSIYFRIRYRRLQRHQQRIAQILHEGAWELAEKKASLREAGRLIKGAMDGGYLVVTKPPRGMTLDEAQREIDRAVGIFYKPKGNA